MADRLTGLDSSFLHLERDETQMHVASTQVFAGEPPAYGELCSHIASRLALVPRFRQKLRFVPFGQGRPVWVDDPHFNLEYHVRRTALPPPGSEEQLKRLAGRVFSQHLDRSKPLWEMWLVSGLEGDRFALLGKSHHCLVDGVSGVDVTTVLFDAEPGQAEPVAEEEWLPRPEPSDADLLLEALLERAVSPAEAMRAVRALLRGPRRLAGHALEALASTGAFVGTGLDLAPTTPINRQIGPHRRVAWVRADLEAFKQVKDELGGTVNDVVLAVVTGALGRYLAARGHSIRDLELKAMVPVSIRAEDERGALGNRVAAVMAHLPVWCEEPVRRLRTLSHTMGDLKRSKQATGAAMLTQLADFAPPTVLSQASRLQSRQRVFNLVITNIPGPQFPLYVLGRRMTDLFPMVPLAKNQGLSIGIMSYDGQINFGLVGDWDVMAAIESLAEDLRASIEELASAADVTRDAVRDEGPGSAQAIEGASGSRSRAPRMSASENSRSSSSPAK